MVGGRPSFAGGGVALRAGGTTAVSSGSVVLHDAETLPFFTAEAIAAAARAADAETFAALRAFLENPPVIAPPSATVTISFDANGGTGRMPAAAR